MFVNDVDPAPQGSTSSFVSHDVNPLALQIKFTELQQPFKDIAGQEIKVSATLISRVNYNKEAQDR